MRTSELSGAALDWAVATAEGWRTDKASDAKGEYLWLFKDGEGRNPKHYHPSTNWAQGGPIIEREGVEVVKGNPLYFPKGNENGDYYEPLWVAGNQHGQTPLIAAMRCYVASKLGDEIELPEGL